MVKGVNKRVIEVNNTGNKYFEKIVFYVTPEYNDLTAEQLKCATEFLSLKIRDKAELREPSLRKRVSRRRKITALLILGAVLLAGFCVIRIIL